MPGDGCLNRGQKPAPLKIDFAIILIVLFASTLAQLPAL
jgi:hypothetical protein